MNKVINNKIKYSLGILAIFTLGVLTLVPNSADARDRAGYYKGYSEDFVNTSYIYSGSYSTAYNPTPGTTTGSVLGTATTKPVAKAPAKATTTDTTDYKEVKEEFSNTTANALFGADGFFPTSLMGWLLFAIFVLIIIALVRKFAGLEDKYHSTPLKHS